MTDLTSLSQLQDQKNLVVVFFDPAIDNEESLKAQGKLEDELLDRKDILKANVNEGIGKDLKEAHGVDYIPSAIVIKNGKPFLRQGAGAILREVK